MSSPHQTPGKHIADLVDFAVQAGQPDVYSGKRRRQRYRLKMPLEIALQGESRESVFSVELHDVSAGGVGFWTEQPLRSDTKLLIREWQPQGPQDWIPALVVHCTRGLSGYLIGARFGAETAAVVSSESLEPAAIEPQPALPVVRRSRAMGTGEPVAAGSRASWTLRGKCMLIAAGCSGIGVLGAGAALANGMALGAPFITVPVVAALCSVLAAGLMWLLLADEARYLDALRFGLDELTETGKLPPELERPPCPDMNDLDRVLIRLRDEIGRHRAAAAAQREKLAALEEVETTILNMVAHDLRTPLTSILLYSELMRSELQTLDAGEQQHCLEIISVETHRLSRLIENMTKAQSMSSGEIDTQRAQVSLPKIFEECVQDYEGLASSKGITLEVDCPADFPVFESDVGQVAQVLSNLVGNALKFTPRDGCVHVAAELHSQEVLFSVSDNGPGVPRMKWDSIFDRFTQLRGSFLGESPGVGIGLFVVQKIVDRLGGRVWVDSEPGKGAEFCVVLPRTAREVEPKTTINARVLVCDYDPELTARMAQFLRWHGFQVEVAYCAQRLLEKIAESDFDVVLTDILLHDRPTKDILAELCVSGRKYRLVAHTHITQAAELREHGVDIVLTRPAERTDIIEAVQAAVNMRPNCATVLIVAPPEHALAAYGQRLASEGHLGLMVHTCDEAAAQAREYPFDRILIASELLDEDWSALAPLLQMVSTPHMVVVVAVQLGKAERKRMQQLGVEVVSEHALTAAAPALALRAAVMV